MDPRLSKASGGASAIYPESAGVFECERSIREAHVFMDTPLRDTLSREAHEFVWCQEDCYGVKSKSSGSSGSSFELWPEMEQSAADVGDPPNPGYLADFAKEHGATSTF